MPAFTVEEMTEEILTKVQTPYDLLRVDPDAKPPKGSE
jgi:hypothetical protein